MAIKAKKSSAKKSKKLFLSSKKLRSLTGLLIIAVVTVLGVKILFVSHADTPTINGTPVGIASSSSPTGYWIAATDGGVFAEGTAPFYGSMGNKTLSAPIGGIASSQDKKGYYLFGSDGAVYAFGDATYKGGVNNANTGGTSALVPGARIVAMAVDPANGGYSLVDNFGHIYAFGGAPYYNVNSWTSPTNETVSSIAFNPSGSGFYALTTDGRVLSFGSVAGQGGNVGSTANGEKWIGITAEPGTNGYIITSNIGGVYNESGAAYYGAATATNPVGGIIGVTATSDGKGYWLIGGDGGIFAYGDSVYQGRVATAPPPTATPTAPAAPVTIGAKPISGSATPTANGAIATSNTGSTVTSTDAGAAVTLAADETKVNAPAVGIISDTANDGYLQATTDGGVFAYGKAIFHGSAGADNINNIVGIARPSSSDNGYFLVGSDGGVFAYNLPFSGSMGGKKLNGPVVGIAATPDGKGYWLAGSDGGVFAFGDAQFLGSMGGKSLNQPIVGIASTSDGKGYWLVASDGGVFAFGDAHFYGSMGGKTLIGWVVGITSTSDGKGYYLQSSDGGVFSYGDAQYYGRIVYPPPTLSLSANPTPVWAGWPVKLSWSVGNNDEASGFVSGCDASEGLTNLNSSQSFTAPTTLGICNYTLTVIGAGGTDDVQVPLQVIIPPPTVSIATVPQTITQGDGTILEWSSTNATGVSISVANVANGSPVLNSANTSASGSIAGFGSNLNQGTYKVNISATNASGFTATKSTTLIVLPFVAQGGGGGASGAGDAPAGTGSSTKIAPAGTYTYVYFPDSNLTTVSSDTTINDVQNLGSAPYFWSHSFYFANAPANGTAYIGIQGVNRAVFSVFDWPSKQASSSCIVSQSGFDGGYYSFGGTSCIIPYKVTQGVTYRTTVTKVGQDAKGIEWQGSVTNLTTGVKTVIATVAVPSSWGDISNTSTVWTEYFRVNSQHLIASCSVLTLSKVTFSNFTGSNDTGSYVLNNHSDSITQNACSGYSQITDNGPNSFTQQMGGK